MSSHWGWDLIRNIFMAHLYKKVKMSVCTIWGRHTYQLTIIIVLPIPADAMLTLCWYFGHTTPGCVRIQRVATAKLSHCVSQQITFFRNISLFQLTLEPRISPSCISRHKNNRGMHSASLIFAIQAETRVTTIISPLPAIYSWDDSVTLGMSSDVIITVSSCWMLMLYGQGRLFLSGGINLRTEKIKEVVLVVQLCMTFLDKQIAFSNISQW